MKSYLLLLELGHAGWDLSGYGGFVRLSFAQTSRGERSITITVSTTNDLLRLMYLPIKAFAATVLKFSNDMSSPSFM